MELFKNFATTTLNGGIDGSTTSVVVTDGTIFPSTGNFNIVIDVEIMKCTSRSSNTLTVVRAQEGSSGVSHSNGAQVTNVLTAQGLQNFREDNIDGGTFASIFSASKEGRLYITTNSPFIARDKGASVDHFHPLFDATKPVNGDFAWVNQGTATVTDTNVGIYLESTTLQAATNLKIRKKAQPSTPYKIRANLLPARQNVNFHQCGIGFRESATGKLELIELIRDTESKIQANKFDSPTLFNSTRATKIATKMYPWPTWLQIENDNTDLFLKYSNDGYYFYTLASFAKNNFFTTAPDEILFCVDVANISFKSAATLLSWEQF